MMECSFYYPCMLWVSDCATLLLSHMSIVSAVCYALLNICHMVSYCMTWTRRLCGCNSLRYNVDCLQQHRLYFDLLWCYKILFELVHVDRGYFLNYDPASREANFFAQCVMKLLNNLPSDQVDFGSFLATDAQSDSSISLSLSPQYLSTLPLIFAVYILYCVVCFIHCPVLNTHMLWCFGQL